MEMSHGQNCWSGKPCETGWGWGVGGGQEGSAATKDSARILLSSSFSFCLFLFSSSSWSSFFGLFLVRKMPVCPKGCDASVNVCAQACMRACVCACVCKCVFRRHDPLKRLPLCHITAVYRGCYETKMKPDWNDHNNITMKKSILILICHLITWIKHPEQNSHSQSAAVC